ncbi:AAA domain-containing protein [Paenibacillus sp. P96]|uniref:AAA domain-containing protein n=1 Tax=Paenibacillus zeirhizosphaerae TaxID=2987519 RepID=A0ABT9FXK1_9BACL|nr:AAA domain-containing protein [Paenibacillus sp. P96]MDP4099458.1 AAA domain-containing protein [Paenibacillus sp. P96]
MNEEHYLVLVKGKDKTTEIQSYEVRDTVVWITYQGSLKTYPYALRDVMFVQNPIITEITNAMVVYHKNIPLNNVKLTIDFGSNIRIKFNNNTSRVYDTDSIRIESSSVMTTTAKAIMYYLETVSHHTRSTEEEAFLEKQYKKLSFISPNSVLSSYLNGDPIKVESKPVSHTIFPFNFNLSQKEALDRAMCSQISIIEGPPGTGKTQTILNILANLVVMQNKKVAVVSGNNAAVQNVWEKMTAKGYQFLVAALGNAENKKKFFDNPPYQDVTAWKSEIDEGELLKQIKEIDVEIQKLMELERDKAKLQQLLSAYQLEWEHFNTYYAKQDVEQIGKLSFYRQTPDKILSFLVDNHIAVEQGKTDSILHKLKLLLRHGFINFKRLNKNRELEVILNLQRKYYEMKIEQLTEQVSAIERELDQSSFKTLLMQHQQYSEKLLRHKLYQKYHGHTPIKETADSYMKNFAKFLEQYPIMLSTTHSLRNCVPNNFLFDYVIIDESSQVDLLTAALALSCCKNVIIVGDIKQLPQIVDMSIEEKLNGVTVEEGGPYDYFRHNLLSSMLKLYGDSIPKVMLREHYRCHPKIIEFCNRKYYDGQLIAYTTEQEGDSPLLIYRTTAGNHMRELTHGQKGKFNQRELDVIKQEVLVDLKTAASRHNDIGFTTPYRKQVNKASEQLSQTIEFDTIHKYQGREKPIMIMSSVLDSSKAGKMGLRFVNDPCMINVGVSRAQQKFILVTDHSLFRKYGNEIGDLIRYMEYSTVDDNIVESEVVSVFDLLYKEYSDKLEAFKKRITQKSKYASENIMRTLLKDILHESPYSMLEIGTQVFLGNLFVHLDKLKEEERRYIKNGASVDFVLYNKLDKSPVLAIEVDGFAFHENNLRQQERDHLKDNIFKAYGLPLLRFPTTGSGEERRIRVELDVILRK